MTKCRPRVLRKDCKTDGGKEESVKTCPPFSFCVGNKTVSFDGECITVADRKYKIPDGTYSTVTFKDGCIVDVGHMPVPAYTPNDCCGGSSGDVNGADVIISPNPANLLKLLPDGLAVMPMLKGSGIDVSGSGTADDPFTLSASASESGGRVFINSGTPTSLSVSGDGTSFQDPVNISLNKMITAGRYAGLIINEYGQVTGVDDLNPVVTNIEADSPIVATRSGESVKLTFDATELNNEIINALQQLKNDYDAKLATQAAEFDAKLQALREELQGSSGGNDASSEV